MSETLLAALVGAAIGAIPGVYSVWQLRRKTQSETSKNDAEAAQTVSGAAMTLLEPLTKRIDDLQVQVDALKTRVKFLETMLDQVECERDDVTIGANRLFQQVLSLGGQPVYTPPAVKRE